MAERTGLEPATPGVTGRYSNQLNYRSVFSYKRWWVLQGSNLRPTACKAVALPTELNTLGQVKGAYLTLWPWTVNQTDVTAAATAQ